MIPDQEMLTCTVSARRHTSMHSTLLQVLHTKFSGIIYVHRSHLHTECRGTCQQAQSSHHNTLAKASTVYTSLHPREYAKTTTSVLHSRSARVQLLCKARLLTGKSHRDSYLWQILECSINAAEVILGFCKREHRGMQFGNCFLCSTNTDGPEELVLELHGVS